MRFSDDLKKELDKSKHELLELRLYVDAYYDVQRCRIMQQLRMERVAKHYVIKKSIVTRLHEDSDKALKSIECRIKAKIQRELVDVAIWNYWLKGIKGVGPVIAGGLVAWLYDIRRFPTISQLWAYCGLAVKDGRAQRFRRGDKAEDRSTNNPHLKTLAWKAAQCFVKRGKFYQNYYKEFREDYDKKFRLTYDKCGVIHTVTDKDDIKSYQESGGLYRGPTVDELKLLDKPAKPFAGIIVPCTDGHRYNMAARKMIKLFLGHLFDRWYSMLGLVPDKPWIIGRDGHRHYIAAPSAEKTATRKPKRKALVA
jgi:hypothetical protein